jgi:hypothetical protein
VDFTIVAVRVPTVVSSLGQNVAILRLNTAPPTFGSTTSAFTTLLYRRNVPGTGWISTNISVRAGQFIGFLGARGTTTMYNSYASSHQVPSSIKGRSITLRRFGMQFNLFTTPPRNVWNENSGSIARVEVRYR